MNVAVLSGRLVADPELRTTGSGKQVANFRVAVDRPYRDANGNRHADFFTCVLWGNGAPLIHEWRKKGDFVELSGRFENRTYQAQDGSKRTVTEMIVNEWKAIGGKREEQGDAGTQADAGASAGGFTPVDEDELPF